MNVGSRRCRHLLVAASAVVLLASCGVQAEQSDRPLSRDDLAFTPLEEPGPASTTTSGVIAPGSTTTAPATTVTAPTASYPLDIYWVAGDAIHRERRRTVEANLDEAIRALRSGPTGEETSKGLRSAIAEAGMIVDAATASGTARIELGSSFLTLPGAEQTLAIAQIVYTVTVVPGIGQIEFTLNGQPLPVPRGDGQPSTGSVSRDDYASLLEGLRPSQSPGTQIATTTAFSEPGSGSRP